jgi:DNA gyrase/topoisomerase IV subunit A
MGAANRRSTEEYGQDHLLKQERLLSACVQAVDAWQDVSRIIVGSVTKSSAIEHLGETLGLDADQAGAVLAMPMGAVMNGAAQLRRNLGNVRAELASAERNRRWQGSRGELVWDDSAD